MLRIILHLRNEPIKTRCTVIAGQSQMIPPPRIPWRRYCVNCLMVLNEVEGAICEI
jgi:hypothetical protein